MKTLGLIGGIAWQSTVTYYSLINSEVQRRIGGAHSARILLHSVDFAEIIALQNEGRWQDGGEMLGRAAAGLVQTGAEVLVLCCNTMHVVADAIGAKAGMALLHIADPLGEAILKAGLSRVALLGTLYTMQMPGVLRARLEDRHGLDVLVPDEADASALHTILYEFQKGGAAAFPAAARRRCRDIVARLEDKGAEGIILGCTELPLMLDSSDSSLPLFDTATLHALAAVDAALAEG